MFYSIKFAWVLRVRTESKSLRCTFPFRGSEIYSAFLNWRRILTTYRGRIFRKGRIYNWEGGCRTRIWLPYSIFCYFSPRTIIIIVFFKGFEIDFRQISFWKGGGTRIPWDPILDPQVGGRRYWFHCRLSRPSSSPSVCFRHWMVSHYPSSHYATLASFCTILPTHTCSHSIV